LTIVPDIKVIFMLCLLGLSIENNHVVINYCKIFNSEVYIEKQFKREF